MFSSSKSSIYCLNLIDYIFAPMDDDRPCLSKSHFKGISLQKNMNYFVLLFVVFICMNYNEFLIV